MMQYFIIQIISEHITGIQKKKNISGKLSEYQTAWTQTRPNGPDMGSNCLQRSATDDKVRRR